MFLTVDAVSTALAKFLSEVVGIDEDTWSIVWASPPGKRFLIKFSLLPIQNARLAAKVFENMRDANQEWRVFNAIATDGSTQRLRLDKDENPRERAERTMGNMCKRAITAVYPNAKNVHTRRDRGLATTLVYAGEGKAIPLCSMQPSSLDIVPDFFHWNYDGLAELAYSREALLEAIRKDGEKEVNNITCRV